MLTPEQINEIRTKSGLKPIQSSKQPKQAVGRFDYLLKEEKKGFVDKVKESWNKRGTQNAEDIADTNPIRAILRTTGAGAGFVNDVIGAGIEKVAPNFSEKVGEVMGKVAETDTAQGILTAYNTFKEKYPEAAKDLESSLNIASLLPQAKALELGGSAVKAGAEVGMKGAKVVLKDTGKVLEKAGEKSYKLAVPLSKPEAGLVQNYRANNPLLQRVFKPLAEQPRTAAVTAIDKGFAGSEAMIGVQAKKEAVNLWNNKIAPALKSIPEKYDIRSGISEIEKKISKVAEPSRRNALNEALQALKDDYTGFSKVSYTKAQKIKSELDQFIPDKAFQGKPIAGSFKEVQKMLADDIRSKTYKLLGDENIRMDFLDYGNLKGLQEWGKTAMTGSKAKAGFGSFISNLYETAAIPALTASGKVLVKAGQNLKGLSK